MFELETQLVEKLVDDLRQKYGINYIARELRSGINIADIVCAKIINRDIVLFDEYSNSRHYFDKIYNRKGVDLSKLKELSPNDRAKFNKFILHLQECGYVELTDKKMINLKKVEKATDSLIAIEAKLTDWRKGIIQAKRYKQYADKVYVAISASLKDSIDIEQFKKENIGLILVSEEETKIFIRCKKEAPKKKDIKYYMEDKFIEKVVDYCKEL